MTTDLHRSVLLRILAVGAFATVTSPASATNRPLTPCEMNELRGVATPTNVPANVPAFALVWHGANEPPPPFTLTTKDGAPVAAAVTADGPGRFLLAPAAPLEVGRAYVVTAPLHDCATPAPVDITAGDAKPLPTTIGTLRASSEQFDYVTIEGDDFPEGEITLTLDPSPDLLPFFDTTLLTLTLDGNLSGAAEFPNRYASTPVQISFRVVCDQDHANLGTAAGTHQLTASARVAGTSTELPPVTTSFTLDCKGAPPSKSGCSFGGASASNGLAALTVIACAAAVSRRRRRGRTVRGERSTRDT